MDQEKIGAFITECRKQAGLTQAALGEQLGITDRAVSKWERGKSMPDPSLMLPLCGLLHITVNELLTGERISMEDYQKKAEEKLLELQKQEALNNRRLLWLEVVIGLLSTAAALVMIFAASFAVVYFWWRLALIAAGLAILTVGIAVAVKLEHDAGYYECPHWSRQVCPHHAGGGILPPHWEKPEDEMPPLRPAGVSQENIDQVTVARKPRRVLPAARAPKASQSSRPQARKK